MSRIPITVKVPVVVAILMAAVGILASEQVLSRLAATQDRQIADLTNAFLDGLASPLIEPVLRADSWEVFDILDQSRQLSAAVRPIETLVVDAGGVVLAGSDPRHSPIGSDLPPEFSSASGDAGETSRPAEDRALANRELIVEGRRIGMLYAAFDTSALLAERREVIWTLVSTNAAVTTLFVALGWFAVRRMVRPMQVLADHLEAAPSAVVKPIPLDLLPNPDTEAGRLFRRFNEMAGAIAENATLAARLADEERLASLGRLASGMAHEINNPLGGLFNAIDTLRKHGDKPGVRAKSLPLIERGLFGIRDVVQAALATYRSKDGERHLTRQDLEDLRLLIGPEIRRRNQTLEWRVDVVDLPSLPGSLVRQAALNLLLNASAVSGEGGRVSLSAAVPCAGTLSLSIGDSGSGLPLEAEAVLTGKHGAAIMTGGKGLGLWMVHRLVGEIGGTIAIRASAFGGTEIQLMLTPAATQPTFQAA